MGSLIYMHMPKVGQILNECVWVCKVTSEVRLVHRYLTVEVSVLGLEPR